MTRKTGFEIQLHKTLTETEITWPQLQVSLKLGHK